MGRRVRVVEGKKGNEKTVRGESRQAGGSEGRRKRGEGKTAGQGMERRMRRRGEIRKVEKGVIKQTYSSVQCSVKRASTGILTSKKNIDKNISARHVVPLLSILIRQCARKRTPIFSNQIAICAAS